MAFRLSFDVFILEEATLSASKFIDEALNKSP